MHSRNKGGESHCTEKENEAGNGGLVRQDLKGRGMRQGYSSDTVNGREWRASGGDGNEAEWDCSKITSGRECRMP